MSVITRGFTGRRRGEGADLPPGQYLTDDFPVLSAGPTPRIDLATWRLGVTTESGERREWDWPAFLDLPSDEPTVDLHCVTKWSKLGTVWRGGALDTLRAGQPGADEGTVAVAVRAQKGKRIAVFALLQGLDGGTFGGSLHGGGQVVHGCDFSSSGLHRSTNPCSGTSSQSGR